MHQSSMIFTTWESVASEIAAHLILQHASTLNYSITHQIAQAAGGHHCPTLIS